MRLTVREVMDNYGGSMPPWATLRGDDDLAEPGPPVQPTPAAVKQKGRMRSERFAVLNAFVDFGICAAALTPAEALVWLILFRDTKATGTARTGQTDIARRAGLSVRGVKKAIRALTTKGMVDVVRRGRLNAGPSTYRVSPTRRMG